MHEYLRRESRARASLSDVDQVYENEMLSVRGQVDLEHYQGRLRVVLRTEEYRVALELLTEAAVNGGLLSDDVIDQYSRHLRSKVNAGADPIVTEDVLYLLEHDGYLERQGGGYRFISGLLEDWWRIRYGQNFAPIMSRQKLTKERI